MSEFYGPSRRQLPVSTVGSEITLGIRVGDKTDTYSVGAEGSAPQTHPHVISRRVVVDWRPLLTAGTVNLRVIGLVPRHRPDDRVSFRARQGNRVSAHGGYVRL